MKKRKKERQTRCRRVRLLTGLLLLAGMLGCSVPVTAKTSEAASDVTVKVREFSVFDPAGKPVDVKKGDEVSDRAEEYSSQITPQKSHRGVILLNILKNNGKTFAQGEEITIPVRAYAATGNRTNTGLAAPTAWTDLADSSGTVIGQWTMEGSAANYGKRTIRIRLNEKAAGKAVLSDVTIDLGNKGIMTWGVGYAIAAKISIGDTMFAYAVREREKIPFHDAAFQASASNRMAICGVRFGTDLYNSLIDSRGEKGTPESVLVESFYENASSADFIRVTGVNEAPYSLTEPGGCFITDYLVANYAASCTGLEPEKGESYEAFRKRVMEKPLQYGAYPQKDGVRFVFYGGVVGVDTPVYSEYKDFDVPSNVAHAMIEQGWYKESDYDALNAIYAGAIRDSKVTGEHITASNVALQVNYHAVLEDTGYPAETVITYNPGQDSERRKTYSQTIALTGMFGKISAKPFSAAVMKYDADSAEALQGAAVKLQLLQKDGTWADYTPEDQGTLERITNKDGLQTFENLGLGTYRAVETKAPEGYSLADSPGYDKKSKTVISAPFVIREKDTQGAKVQMANKRTPQTAAVIYKDQTSDKVLRTDRLKGNAGEKIAYDAESRIQAYLEQGYTLVSSDFREGILFDQDDGQEQVFTVLLRHGTSTKEETKTIQRTIRYIYGSNDEGPAEDESEGEEKGQEERPEPGSPAAEDVVQKVTFRRTAKTDLVTHSMTYSAYEPETQSFDAVDSPEVFNYTPSLARVEARNISASDKNMTVVITYSRKPDQKAEVIIRDESSETDLHREILTGPRGTAIGYDVGPDLEELLKKGYELKENAYPGPLTLYDEDDSADQEYLVLVAPVIERILPDDPRTPEDPMNPDGTPYPEGLDHDSLNRTVRRSIHYIYGQYNENANHEGTPEPGSEAAEDVKQEVSFSREALVNHVTAQVSYEPWQPESALLEEVLSPVIGNFTASAEKTEALEVMPEDSDTEEEIIYRQKDDQKAAVIIRDMESGEDLFLKNLSGPSGTEFGYEITDDLSRILQSGYRLNDNPYPGANALFDEEDTVLQEYVVTVRKIRKEMPAVDQEETGFPKKADASVRTTAQMPSDQTGKTSGTASVSAPKTGDEMHLLFYALLIAAAGSIAAAAAVRKIH